MSGKKKLAFLLVGIIAVSLVASFILSQYQTDFRSRALQGQANLLLNTSNASPKTGETFDVVMSMQMTDDALRVSGADLMLVYDKSKVEVEPNGIIPFASTTDASQPFTDVIYTSSGGSFDTTNNFLRVVVVARKPDTDLSPKTAGAAVNVARVTFRALAAGTGTIAYPADNTSMQIVGIGVGAYPTP